MESWQPEFLVIESELVLMIFNGDLQLEDALKVCDSIARTVDEAILRIGYGK